MKHLLQRYIQWSDKINKPFYDNKHRILLYVALSQSVIVTIQLLTLFQKPNHQQIIMICRPYDYELICHQVSELGS
jgi:hypothetical protein